MALEGRNVDMPSLAREPRASDSGAVGGYRSWWTIGRTLIEPPWRRILRRTQDRISATDAHPYYLQTYRGTEAAYWSRIPAWIWKDCRKRRVERCLDIGCAYGTLLLYTKMAARCEAYGLDFVEGFMSRRLAAEEGLHWQQCNIELQPCPWPGPFDVVILTEVLEHFNFQAVPTLRKIRDLMSADGRFYLSTPDAAHWGKQTKYYARCEDLPPPDATMLGRTTRDHIWHFSRGELEDVMGRAGLKIVRIASVRGPDLGQFNLTLAPT
jgi:SAM-dependent methyltransferase